MPNLDTLAVTFSPSISGSAGKSVKGLDYKGPSQPIGISRTFSFGKSNANTSVGGADEFISYLFMIPGGTVGIVDLTNLTDYLLQLGVNLARVKAWRFNLVSVGQDSTNGTACSKVTIGGTIEPPYLAPPTTSTVGGSLAPGLYNYAVTATTASGETIGSNVQTITVPTGTSNNVVTLNWNAVPNATGYNVYRNTTGTFGPTSKVNASTIASGTLTYVDTGAVLQSGQPPTSSQALPPSPFLFNKTSGYDGTQLLSGDYQEYATGDPNGWAIATGNSKVYITNNDQNNPPLTAAFQLTLVGGTS
jgi:hypothetical protein